jgi:hypothetical protein
MSDDTQSTPPSIPMRGQGCKCEPDSPGPSDQPKDPGGDCTNLPPDNPPVLKDPEKCVPDPKCECPHPPAVHPTCFDDLIAKEGKEISEGDRAKISKADLEALQAKAKAAAADYTRDKYKKLVAQWVQNDAGIAELIRKLVCAVPCWWCLIECEICPLLYEIRYRQQLLYGDGALYPEVHSLYDLRYWHDRNRYAKKYALDRIKAVLAAWEKPAQTIEKILADNAKLVSDAGKTVALDGKLVYDVFLRLVPLHLAIAPPASSGKVTNIAKRYTQFCECDKGKPDNCCGPDVGVLSLRQRLIGPQPYLIPPGKYFDLICCLATKRYLPAKDAWSQAESAFEDVDAQIKRLTGEVDDKIKSFDKNAKGALPVDCSDWGTPTQDQAQTN